MYNSICKMNKISIKQILNVKIISLVKKILDFLKYWLFIFYLHILYTNNNNNETS